MATSFENVVIVTGAAGGIGQEIVRHLLVDHNAAVVATDIVEGALQELKTEHPHAIEVVIANIISPETSKLLVSRAIERFGKLTGVCLNAGVFGPCFRLENAPVDKWVKGLEINVLSHLHTLKHAIPELRKTGGRVTASTSGAGQTPLFSGWGFYGMSKASVSFMIKQLHLEEKNITALGISPGLCDTKMVAGLLSGEHEGWGKDDVEKYKSFVSQIELITPARAGYVFAAAVINADPSISGETVDYDDPRLPIEEGLKRKSDTVIDYTAHTA